MKKNFFLILALVGIAIIYWPVFLPHLLAANDFPLLHINTLKSYFDLPPTWMAYGSGGLGYYSIIILWTWPLLFLSGSLAQLGLNYDLIIRLVYLIPILALGYWSSVLISRQLKLNPAGQAVFLTLYLGNTYLLTLIDGGQLQIGLAFAIFPGLYILICQSFLQPWRHKLLVALFTAAFAAIEIRFLFLLAILVISKLGFDLIFGSGRRRLLTGAFQTGLLLGITLVGLNLWWILPALTTPLTTTTVAYLTQTSFSSFANFGHGLLLITPHWYRNIYGQIDPLNPLFIIFPSLAILAPLIRRHDLNVAYYLWLWLLACFLIKESNPPFGQVYPWLYYHLPLFNLFRDSTKFFFLDLLAASALISLTIDSLTRHTTKILNYLIPSAIIVITITLLSPAWTLQMSGLFSPHSDQVLFQSIWPILNRQSTFSRTLWLPSTPSLANSDINHPNLEGLQLSQQRPFAAATLGDYEILNFLREAPYMGQLLDVFGVRYLVYPPLNPHQTNLSFDDFNYYAKFFNQLSALDWLKPIPATPIFETSSHQNHLFLANTPWWVIGSDDLYAESTTSAQLALSRNGLIFLEERPELINRFLTQPLGQINLHHKTMTDLSALLIPSAQLYSPAQTLSITPNQDQWWTPRNPISWKDFVKQKYHLTNHDFDLNRGFAVAEGTTSATFQLPHSTPGDILLARVFESSRSGSLIFSQNNQPVGQINTVSELANFRWVTIGQLAQESPLTIQTSGDLNAINALATLSLADWQKYQQLADQLKSQIKDFTPANIATSSATISFQRLSSTHYQLTITDLTHPQLLVLSDSYDPNWQLNGTSALPVYSSLNGFLIDQAGNYDLRFDPQRQVIPGLIFSGVFGVGLVGLTIFRWRRK